MRARMWSLALALGLGGGTVVLTTASCAEREEEHHLSDTGATALATWRSFHVPEADRIPHQLATNPGTPWGDYVGSTSCAPCHPEEHAKWRNSFHSRTLYDAVEATVFGDFSGAAVFNDPRYAFLVLPYTKQDPETGRTRFYMRIRLRSPEARATADTYGTGIPDQVEGDFEILYAFGNRRHQPYVARWPDGKHWVVPVFWNDVDRAWHYDGFRSYVQACGNCHVSGIKTSEEPWYPLQPKHAMTHPPRYGLAPAEEGWAEGAVGCEVCHGPGKAHVQAVEKVGVETYREQRRSGQKGPSIFSGTASQEHMTLQCDQCHDFFTESPVTWVPGPHGFDREPLKSPITRQRAGDAQFYDDGSHKSPCSMGTVFRGTKMYREGVKCTDCHDPHGTDHWADLKAPITRNELCLACHEKQFPDEASQTKHSRHAAGSPGNLCVECHMPRHMIFTNGVQMMSDRIYKHDFSIPTGLRAPGGPPPSCNVCHTDRDDTWTQAVLEAWKTGAPVPR